MALFISTCKYLFVFALTLFFFKLSEQEFRFCSVGNGQRRSKLSKRKINGILFATIAILIICIFAAIRADDVGVDTNGYPVSFMASAKSAGSLKSLFAKNAELSSEPLGALLVCFCSLFTSKTWLLLFFYQFLTIIPVYLAALQFKNSLSITNSMAVYLFVFFNNSLNMMRQSVGCALILLGVTLIIKKRSYVKVALTFIAAILFHRSALYGVLMILAVYFSFNISKKILKYLMYIAVCVVPLFMTSIGNILSTLTDDAHMLYYLDVFIYGKVKKDWFIDPFSVYSITYILVSICLLLMPIMFYTNYFKHKLAFALSDELELVRYKFITFNTIGFLLYSVILFSMNTMYGMRFSLYFDYIYLLSIPLSVKHRKTNKIVMYCILLICWYVWIMRMGWSGSELYHTIL